MNRSGAAISPLRTLAGFDPSQHLLILVDDVALPVGRFRLRGSVDLIEQKHGTALLRWVRRSMVKPVTILGLPGSRRGPSRGDWASAPPHRAR